MDTQIVKYWLDRVTEWSSVIGGQQSDVIKHLSELRMFLRDLHHQIVQWGSPSVALRNIPYVGQLLGRLCCNQALMMQEDDYRLIMQCVLALYTSAEPCSAVEEKAVKWAQGPSLHAWSNKQCLLTQALTLQSLQQTWMYMYHGKSQIRHSVSYYKEKNPCSGVGESIGCLASQYNHTSSLKLLESMVEDLHKVPTTRWDSIANCLVPCSQLSSSTLNHLSELCLPLLTSNTSAVVPLVECLLSCHGNDTEEAMSPAFLEAVMKTQQEAYTDKHCYLELSYEGMVSLWTRYLPALESEFLNLTQALVTVLPSSELRAQELISSRQLPMACAEHPSLHTAVQNLMELLLQNTKGSSFTLMLMEVFSTCVKDKQQALTQPHNLHCRVNTKMGSLDHHLQVNPYNLPISLLTLHINNISNCLTQISSADHSGRIQVWLPLVRSQEWHHAAIKILLHGSADTRPACLNILAWYNIPLVPDRHPQYKAQLGDLVTSLRGLCCKSSVQTHDLHCALDPLQGEELRQSHILNVIRPLLMLFLVSGNGVYHMMDDIIRMASGRDEPTAITRFIFFLESVEFTHMGESAQQGLGHHGKHIASALREYKEAYVAEYQRERHLAETIPLTEEQNLDLLGRYDRVLELVM